MPPAPDVEKFIASWPPESYTRDGQHQYAGIWEKNDDGSRWLMWRDLTSDGYSEKFDELDEEYRVVDFDAYQIADGIRYVAIWHDNREAVPVAP